MEHHQSQEEAPHGCNTIPPAAGANKTSFLSRQSSTRWIPTTEQIRILRDLYYNSGVRSPTAEQIQRISSRLRQYGKIEGKNVFYWFQNHKARERQKKRLTVDVPPSSKLPNTISPGVSPTSAGVYNNGPMVMERSFRDCSLGGSSVIEGNMGWVGVDPPAVPQYYCHHQHRPAPIYYYDDSSNYYYHPHFNHKKEEATQIEIEIETLPLFPIHTHHHQEEETRDYSYYHEPQVEHLHCSGNDASLELTLNSYHSLQHHS